MTKVRYSPAIGLWSGFAKQVQEERQREVKELPEVPSVRKAARVVELGECTSAPGSSASVRSSVRSHVQSTGNEGWIELSAVLREWELESCKRTASQWPYFGIATGGATVASFE